MARYIDAEVLKKRMFSYYDCVNEKAGKSNYNGETLMNYEVSDMIEDCIDNAPTADVVEVKHGKWKAPTGRLSCFEGRYIICSECDVMIPIIAELYDYYYCPKCGACMDIYRGKRVGDN